MLVIALILLALLAPAAGAIYVEGADVPDDGQMHILAAETGDATTPAADPADIVDGGPPAEPNDNVLMPGDDPDMMYALDTAAPADDVMLISAPAYEPLYTSMYPASWAMDPEKYISAEMSHVTMMPDMSFIDALNRYVPSQSTVAPSIFDGIGADTYGMGSIIMPSMPDCGNAQLQKYMDMALPLFTFPALLVL
jgi:hypothetical protein